MKVAGVIPGRMGSTRLPGKPLADVLGKPLIEHIYHRARMSRVLDEVIVATCDEEIRQAAEGFGARVVMTSSDHERATERVAEAARDMDADIIVMLQGDEPMVRPEMIDAAVAPMIDEGCGCVNLCKRIEEEQDFLSPNTIKVVMDRQWNALFMTRQPVPTLPDGWPPADPVFKQVCIIPFRADVLRRYVTLDPTPLEIAESVDMMRLIEHGEPVRMVETDINIQAVDTEEDRVRVAQLMANDPLLEAY